MEQPVSKASLLFFGHLRQHDRVVVGEVFIVHHEHDLRQIELYLRPGQRGRCGVYLVMVLGGRHVDGPPTEQQVLLDVLCLDGSVGVVEVGEDALT